MVLYTLSNDFHGTETRVRVAGNGVMSRRAVRRAWSTLCGSPDCTCGGPCGERGPQDGFRVAGMADGGAAIIVDRYAPSR